MSKRNKYFKNWKLKISRWFHSAPESQEALVALLNQCYTDKLINLDTFTMLECVLELAPMQVRDIVIPKTQMISIAQDATLPQVIEIVTESGHSRFPVTGETSDEIIGILHAKDLLRYQNHEKYAFDLYDLLRPATFVPEGKRLLTLLSELRKNRNHMAIVVDEYGAVDGVITIEDIVEQIIGEIEDEFDIEDERFIKELGNERFTLLGHTPIEIFNEAFHASFSDETYDTIAGILTGEFGHLPKRGETLQIEGFQFKVLHADARRIQLIECLDQRTKEG